MIIGYGSQYSYKVCSVVIREDGSFERKQAQTIEENGVTEKEWLG